MNKKLLRKKLALMLATLKKKRKYYCEVEYLESTGTQYIDTGYTMSNDNMTFDGNIMWTQSNGNANFFYGYRSVNLAEYRGDMRAFFVYGTSAPPAGRLAIRYGVNTDNSTSTISQNQKYNISFDGTDLKVDGTTFTNLSDAYTPANYQNMYLFWCNCTGYYSADVAKFSGRIYNWQIKQDGVLVRDFIPVLDWNYVPCMYDRVTEQLFYNQGTGNFTAGREIHPVDYLESTGTQYVNTKVVPTQNTKVNSSFELTSIPSDTYATLFGAYSGSSPNGFALYLNNTVPIQARTGNSSGGNIISTFNVAVGQYDVSLEFNKLTINNATFVPTTLNTWATLSENMYLFNANTVTDVGHSRITPCRIYYTKVYSGDNLVRDFIPAIDENGVGFMFDLVSHTCFLNAGTGAFKYPAREVEYLKGTGPQYIDTGVKTTQNTSAEYQCLVINETGNTDKHIFGARTSATSEAFDFAWMRQSAFNCYRFISGSVNQEISFSSLDRDTILSKHAWYFSGTEIKLDGIVLKTFTTQSYTGLYNIWLFGVNNGGSIHTQVIGQQVYGCKIWDNGTLVRDFVPSYKDGVLGMWDKENNVFYPNAGTGTFTTSKIVEPEYEQH